jgi:hypothetical protein
MSAGYHDPWERRIVGLEPLLLPARRAAPGGAGAWRWRLALALILALMPRADDVAPKIVTAPTPMAVAELPPPPAEPPPPTVAEPPPPVVEPPPAVVEMPLPIPGPPLALAVALAHPPRKPSAPVHVAARMAPLPVVMPASAGATASDAPLLADADAPSADAALSAAETGLVEEYRRCTADNLYHPGGRHDPRCEPVLRLAGKPSGAVPADGWTRLDAGSFGSPPLIKASYDRMGFPIVSTAAHMSGFQPVRIGDLMPDEQRMILTRRGVPPAPAHGVHLASKIRLVATANTSAYRQGGVRAIAAPIDAPPPEIPAAAMQQRGEWIAVARVHVAPDGTSEIAIVQPIADAAVNRAIEEALRRWRFRPTYIGTTGWSWRLAPDDSTIELSVRSP